MLWAMDWGLPSKAPNVLSCIKNITFKSREDWNQNTLSDKSVWPYSQPILDPVASGEAVLLSNLLNFRFVRKREWRPGEGKVKTLTLFGATPSIFLRRGESEKYSKLILHLFRGNRFRIAINKGATWKGQRCSLEMILFRAEKSKTTPYPVARPV